MEGLKLEAFLDYSFLSNVRWSPEGNRAAFVVTVPKEKENAYESKLWLWEQGKLRQLSGMGKEARFFWEDDTHVLFPAVRNEEEKKRKEAGEPFTVFYRLATDGGEAVPAFELPIEADELHAMGEGKFWFTAEIDRKKPDEYKAPKEEQEKHRKEEKENGDYVVLEEHPFWYNGATYRNDTRSAIFLYDTGTGELTRITQADMDVEDCVYLAGKLWYLGEAWTGRPEYRSGLFAWDERTGETKTVIEEGKLYFGGIREYGDELLVRMSEGKAYTYEETPDYYALNTATEEMRLVAPGGLGVGNSVGSDCRFGGGYSLRTVGKDIWFTSTVDSACHLMHIDPEGNTETVLGGTGSVDSFDVNKNGELLAIAMLEGKLQELYAVKDGGTEKLSDFNGKVLAGKYVAPYEKLDYESTGERLTGWVLPPKDYDPQRTYPAVLDIHGGPRTVYGEVFYHEMQLWAGMGYFVFFTNPVGSDGRGDAFADIRGGYGDREYRNLMDFTDAVLRKYTQIDKKRVAVTGGSYGGFMTNWIIGHTDRFCCAATQRSISNWVSFYGTSDIGILFGEYQTDADIFRSPEKMWAQSPLRYAESFKTPTLIIHSDCDYRCPISEGYQLFTALKERGVESRMVIFKGENHELSRGGKPQHRVRRLREITEWFEKYTKTEGKA